MIDTKQTLEALLPKGWLSFFDVTEMKELAKEWQIKLVEKEHLIPEKLKGKDVVQNGYMNPVEVEDYPLRGKSSYLKFFRRRWKEQGGKEGFANDYDFHPGGMKATKEFGAFLKDLNREETNFFRDNWPGSSK
jgi:hypothetical protein